MKYFNVEIGPTRATNLKRTYYLTAVLDDGNEVTIGYDNNGNFYVRTSERMYIEPVASNTIIINQHKND